MGQRLQVRYTDNRGRSNIGAVGLPRARLRDLYHSVLTTKWRWFFLLATVWYASVNAIFAGLYLLEPGSIVGAREGSFLDAYFFSVQTLMTIGYGVMSPGSTYANVLVTLEAYFGMLTAAILTGLVFAKFSRPLANVLISDVCCICPYDGVPTLMFRMANARGNRMVEASLGVSLGRMVTTKEGERFRRVFDLQLVRSHNPMFFVGWTAMHPIDRESPLFGLTRAQLEADNAEILAVLTGIAEDIGATVHARKAWGPEDIRWGERFVDIVSATTDAEGIRVFDYSRFHETQPIDAG